MKPILPASKAEATLALHLKLYGIAAVEQHRFCPERRYRFDFCWPDLMLAVEVEGGAHGIRKQYQHDVERHNVAMLLGWRVLRFTPEDVEHGKAIDLIRAMLSEDTAVALEVAQRGRPERSRTVRNLSAAGVATVGGVRSARGRRKPDDRKDV